jgi:hypothetical protein
MKNLLESVYQYSKKKLIKANKLIAKPSGHRIHRFYKDSQGWFIDLPNWLGTKGQLAMVQGADTFLDTISQNLSEVWVEMSIEPLEGDWSYCLRKTEDLTDGAMYQYINHKGQRDTMWLCGVTEFVFGNMPEKIYCRKVFVK